MRTEYVTHSGSDLLVVDAARASFGKQSEWDWQLFPEFPGSEDMEERAVLKEKDKKLLNFLAREKHLLPFRHPQITLRCRAPIFLARQLGKHQVGMSWSEESRRYITTEPEFYWPEKWRKKADNVKQGSSDEEVLCMTKADGTAIPELSPQMYAENMAEQSMTTYTGLLESGVAPELARMILPQNMRITWVWTGSLLGYFTIYKERSVPTAQKEARDFAELIKRRVQPIYPESWAALEEHLNGH